MEKVNMEIHLIVCFEIKKLVNVEENGVYIKNCQN